MTSEKIDQDLARAHRDRVTGPYLFAGVIVAMVVLGLLGFLALRGMANHNAQIAAKNASKYQGLYTDDQRLRGEVNQLRAQEQQLGVKPAVAPEAPRPPSATGPAPPAPVTTLPPPVRRTPPTTPAPSPTTTPPTTATTTPPTTTTTRPPPPGQCKKLLIVSVCT